MTGEAALAAPANTEPVTSVGALYPAEEMSRSKRLAALSLEKCDRCTLTDVSVLDSDGIGLWMKDVRLHRPTILRILADTASPATP